MGAKEGTAAGLVGALAAGERLTGAGGDSLSLLGQAIDLNIDIGVGGANDDHGLLGRGGDGEQWRGKGLGGERDVGGGMVAIVVEAKRQKGSWGR